MGKFGRVLLIETFIKLKFMWQILLYMCKTMLFFRKKCLNSFESDDIPKGKSHNLRSMIHVIP